ncbi:hypothetical protein [Nocardioides yefusunii]|uniref:Large ribosomal subunit protein bL25 L25 domain-containing protein n=1 Tax=Nocardioides yefusunii TaxID=2500546 RepID=A0ABW1QTA5_9ACTN|nr:hypothetical protein [Nocardioides yefusunii]
MAAVIETIVAEARTEFGKGFARRVRAAGRIPAVFYAAGGEATHISLPQHATTMSLRADKTKLEVEIDGTLKNFSVKEIQVDPIRRVIVHLDLVAA